MGEQTRYSPEVRERAVRLVFEQQSEYESQWAALQSIAAKIGCTTETLRQWVRQSERDQRIRAGLSSEERERLKALERGTASSSEPTRFCARPRPILPRRSSTADADDGVVH